MTMFGQNKLALSESRLFAPFCVRPVRYPQGGEGKKVWGLGPAQGMGFGSSLLDSIRILSKGWA